MKMCSISNTLYFVSMVTGKKSTTIYWFAAVAAELFVMLCAFEAFLFTKNSGLVFSAKQRFAASDSSKKNEIDKRNGR